MARVTQLSKGEIQVKRALNKQKSKLTRLKHVKGMLYCKILVHKI